MIRYGFHMLKDDQLAHMGSSNRYLIRHHHRRLRRMGWRGRRWAIGKWDGE